MKKLKVLVISNYSGRNSSRPEAELMIGMSKMGLDITIMTCKDADYVKDFEEAGIKVIDFLAKKKFDKAEISIIRNELISGDYDIVHLFYSKAIINGLIAARGLKTKVILYRGYCGNIHWWDPTAYFKYLNPSVDAIWCIAPAVADLINRNNLFGKKKAFCITKGHNPDWYKNINPLDLAEFNIPKNAFVASLVANARPMKGLKYLIKSTYKINENIPLYILLIGNGLASKEILKYVSKSPIKERIIFTGFRSDSLSIVKSSDIFILSSIYGEAICKSVIEAMSLGVAPIITDIPGNRYMVENYKSGIIVRRKNPKDIAEAIEFMYNNPEQRQSMGLQAKERMSKHYNIDDTIKQMILFYENIVK